VFERIHGAGLLEAFAHFGISLNLMPAKAKAKGLRIFLKR